MKLSKTIGTYPAFTNDPVTVSLGDGVYSAEETGIARQQRDEYFRDPSDATYMRGLWSRFVGPAGAAELASRLDFRQFKKLGDIGGVPFYQAVVILSRFPHLSALLTDYDAMAIDALRRVPLLSSRELAVFDVKRDDLNLFADCDVLTMWGVDCVLSDEDIGRVVRLGKTLIIGADRRATVFRGLLTRALYSKAGTKLRTLLRGPRQPVRRHGQFRTGSYLRGLIMEHGGHIAHEWLFLDYRLLVVTPPSSLR